MHVLHRSDSLSITKFTADKKGKSHEELVGYDLLATLNVEASGPTHGVLALDLMLGGEHAQEEAVAHTSSHGTS
jgi:hypothetical protein